MFLNKRNKLIKPGQTNQEEEEEEEEISKTDIIKSVVWEKW